MPVPDQMTVAEAAERVGITPLRLLFLLRLHLGSDSQVVNGAELRALSEKLGLQVAPSESAALGHEIKQIEDDDVPRRRLLRQLLSKLERHHHWWPNNCLTDASLRRGFPEEDRGLVRDARDLLLRCGWLKVQTVRHKVTEANVGLNPDFREAVALFVGTAATDEPEIVEWIRSV